LASRAGPGLFRVLGRKAAGVPGYNYSQALTKAGAAGKTWTREELDLFLADPAKNVPGTTMPVGVPDKQARAALVDYLASLQGAVTAVTPAKAATPADRQGGWDDNQPGRIHHIKLTDLP